MSIQHCLWARSQDGRASRTWDIVEGECFHAGTTWQNYGNFKAGLRRNIGMIIIDDIADAVSSFDPIALNKARPIISNCC